MTAIAPHTLAGKNCLVTGGTRGIGAAVAEILANAGARVVVSGRTAPDAIDDRLTFIAADLAEVSGPASLAGRTLEVLGGLDILVSNAGAQTFRPEGVFGFDDADWDADFAINLMASVRLDRALIPAISDVGGSIVHVSSGAARLPRPASLPYSAAKAALSAYSKGLATEVGPKGVRVNCVLPGFIQSDDHLDRIAARAEAAGSTPEDFLRQVVSGIPLRRVGRCEEVAELIAFLVSPAASYISGAQILVDGAAFPTL